MEYINSLTESLLNKHKVYFIFVVFNYIVCIIFIVNTMIYIAKYIICTFVPCNLYCEYCMYCIVYNL